MFIFGFGLLQQATDPPQQGGFPRTLGAADTDGHRRAGSFIGDQPGQRDGIGVKMKTAAAVFSGVLGQICSVSNVALSGILKYLGRIL